MKNLLAIIPQLAVLVALLAPVPAHAAITFTVLQHNIQSEESTPTKEWAALEAQVVAGAHFVGAQEVCRQDFNKFKKRFAAAGWDAQFTRMLKGDDTDRCGGKEMGQMIASAWKISDDSVVALDLPVELPAGIFTGREFKLLCGLIPAAPGGPVRLCTTHLWYARDDDTITERESIRNSQAQVIADYLNPLVDKGEKIILTGDFNSLPTSGVINKLHRIKQNGKVGDKRFWELDQVNNQGELRRGGAATMDNGLKFDYIFVSHHWVGPKAVNMNVMKVSWPAHHLLRGTLSF